jgi:P4 family phage/plasmid primase-like protien
MFDTNIIAQNNGKHKLDSRLQELADAILSVLSAETPEQTVRCLVASEHTNGDANPSLQVSLRSTKNGDTLQLKCWSRNHSPADILSGTGEDFWLELFAEHKGIPVDVLQQAGVRVVAGDNGLIHYEFPYPNGAVRCRWLPKNMWWRDKGTKAKDCLYRPIPMDMDTVVVVEGETDVLSLAAAGFHASGVPGKNLIFSTKLSNSPIRLLPPAVKRVVVVVEGDVNEQEIAKLGGLAADLSKRGVRLEIVRLAGTSYKDVNEMLQDMGVVRFREEFQKLLDAAATVAPDKPSKSATALSMAQEQSASGGGSNGDLPILNDYTFAREVAPYFIDRYRYVLESKQWLAWNGKYWEPVDEKFLVAEASDILRKRYRALLDDAINQNDRAGTDFWFMFLKRAGDYSEVADAVKFLYAWPGIATKRDELDAESWTINCLNGILNLKTMTLEPHDPKRLFTKIVHANYNPNAQGPKWEAHLKYFLPNPNVRRQVLRDLGVALVGTHLQETLPIWFGTGGNGKSTTIAVIRRIMGEYAIQAAKDLLVLDEKGYQRHSTDLVDLYKRRLVFAVETERRQRLAESLVKWLTGGDAIRARRLYENNMEFEPTFSIFLVTNYKPIIIGMDEAIWRRVRLIPWEVQIDPALKRNQDEVVNELLQEADAIFLDMVRGLADFLQDINWVAPEVSAASEEYRREMDSVGLFVDEMCQLKRGWETPKSEVYRAYEKWCAENGEYAVTHKTFSQRLANRGVGEKRGHGGVHVYVGLRLLPTEGDPFATDEPAEGDVVSLDCNVNHVAPCTNHVALEKSRLPYFVNQQGNGDKNTGEKGGDVVLGDVVSRVTDGDRFPQKSVRESCIEKVVGNRSPSVTQNHVAPHVNHVALENHVAPVNVFVRECCDVGSEYAEQFDTLYSEYVDWCKQCGLEPDTETGFGRALTDRGFPVERRGKHRVTYRTGLRLKPEREPVSIDEDALRRALDALQSIVLDDRTMRLLHRMVVHWERECVVYEDRAQEKLSSFVNSFKSHSGLSGIPDRVASWLLLAWFVSGHGCEHVNENGDTVVLGARLRDPNEPQPDPDTDGRHGLEDTPPQPCHPSSDTYNIGAQFEHSDSQELELCAEEPKKSRRKKKQNLTETLDALDYSISTTDNIQPIKERLPMMNTDLSQPTYELPDIEIPEPRPFSELNCVAVDIETTGLDPASGRILAIGWKDKEREQHIWRLPDRCREPIRKLLNGETLSYEENDLLDTWESNIIRRFLKALEQSKPDMLVGYNLYDFDLPYIIGRCEELGVSHPFTIWDYSMRVAGTKGTFKSDADMEFTPIFLPRDWGTAIGDMFHLVCRYDFAARKLSGYDLKTAAGEIAGRQRLVTLSFDNIHDAFLHDTALFDQYLVDDLRDTWALLEKLAPAYYYISQILQYPLWKVFVSGNATLWNHLLCDIYHVDRDTAANMADPKREYAGGLVIAQTGAFVQCHKIDVSSLYPSIMLQFSVHTRKDPELYSLAYLKRFTEERLRLKALAKKGDREADYLQGAYKILINSAYGFLGTAGVAFNDMDAAERVTEIGRELLSRMISALEDGGYYIVEADTDGIIFCGPDAEHGLEVAQAALPEGFKLELDWQDKCVFVSARKNYIIYNQDGSVYDRKGGVYRSRDRNRLNKECQVEFIKRLVFGGAEAAKDYAREIYHLIVSGRAWDLVVERRRVSGKQEHTQFYRQAIAYGYRDNDKVACAYTHGGYSFRPEDGYDEGRYAKDWVDAVKSIIQSTRDRKVSITNERVADNGETE